MAAVVICIQDLNKIKPVTVPEQMGQRFIDPSLAEELLSVDDRC